MDDAPSIILLPGMDGTGDLFGPLLSVLPKRAVARVISYPADRVLAVSELLGLIEERLAEESAVVLVAESFSGPLALRYAARHPRRVRAVVLCASFIRTPVPRWFGLFALPLFFRVPPPAVVVRRWLIGRDAPGPLVQMARAAIGRVKPAVMAGRMRAVIEGDASDALRGCEAPILYLAGSDDRLVGRSSAEAICQVAPAVRVVRIDGPHLLLQHEPAAAWREISKFLGSLNIHVDRECTPRGRL